MRLTDRLDAFAKRHKIATAVIVVAILFVGLEYAHELDKQYTASVRWSMAADRGAT